MIIQCKGCAAKYFLSEDKVPERPTRVRCPKCAAVFTLSPQPARVAAASAGAVTSPQPDPPESVTDPAVDQATPTRQDTGAPRSDAGAKATPRKKKSKKDGESREVRAKRLARVLVSDILCYNQEKRDQALQDGTLMTVLGEEIKKSWEMYKDKVGPELASSTNYFKEALNEILADGQEVF